MAATRRTTTKGKGGNTRATSRRTTVRSATGMTVTAPTRGPGRPPISASLTRAIEQRQAWLAQLSTVDAQYLGRRNALLEKIGQADVKMVGYAAALAAQGLDIGPYLTGMTWGPLGNGSAVIGV